MCKLSFQIIFFCIEDKVVLKGYYPCKLNKEGGHPWQQQPQLNDCVT